jgi:hypothetical protein
LGVHGDEGVFGVFRIPSESRQTCHSQGSMSDTNLFGDD